MKRKKLTLSDHFEKLREIIPEVYTHPSLQEETAERNPLFKVVKRTLSIIEVLYLQNNDALRPATVEEYAHIISDLKALGYDYRGNEALLDRAAGNLIMQAKMPMKKARGVKKSSNQENTKKAI